MNVLVFMFIFFIFLILIYVNISQFLVIFEIILEIQNHGFDQKHNKNRAQSQPQQQLLHLCLLPAIPYYCPITILIKNKKNPSK